MDDARIDGITVDMEGPLRGRLVRSGPGHANPLSRLLGSRGSCGGICPKSLIAPAGRVRPAPLARHTPGIWVGCPRHGASGPLFFKPLRTLK
jgi:hypothetical protein